MAKIARNGRVDMIDEWSTYITTRDRRTFINVCKSHYVEVNRRYKIHKNWKLWLKLTWNDFCLLHPLVNLVVKFHSGLKLWKIVF